MEESEQCPLAFIMPSPRRAQARGERRDAVEHRRRILEVARKLFAEHGVGAVSMHQIAKTAGIGQGTLYRRYAHKGDLCMDLLSERNERLVEDIATLLVEKNNATALERLDGVLEHTLVFLEEQGALLGPVAGATLHHFPCVEGAKSPTFESSSLHFWLYELLTLLLAEAVKDGELATLDIPFTADAILATINPLLYRFQRQQRGYSPERILQGVRHIYIEGIKVPNEINAYPHQDRHET
jgi:AcrR family transcriptional regulator